MIGRSDPGRASPRGEPAPAAAPRQRPSLDAGALAVAAASFALSLYSLLVAGRPPEVMLSAPDVVRVAQGEDAAWLYLQPRFVSTGRNDRVEVISGIEVRAEPTAAGTMALRWEEQGSWVFDHPTRSLNWLFVGDAAPLVVGPNTPQLPVCLFTGPPGSAWTAGTYRVEIVAQREVAGAPLRARFTVNVSADEVAAVNAPRGGQFREIPTGPA